MSQKADLIPVSETPFPAHLVAGAKSYMAVARAKRTREAYARAWALFTAWCKANGRQPLPALPETIAAWMTALADGDRMEGGPRARRTINQYLSAVIVAHRTAGFPFDRKHPLVAETWRGISNAKAKTEVDRAARPLVSIDLRDLLRGLRLDIPADARDAALLSVGWAAALRRSELVGLDWQTLGDGVGFVTVDERGVVVTLAQSKSSQAEAVTVVIPCADMPTACASLEAWSDVAKLEPGQPVFRPVDQRQIIGEVRLTDRSVARILKSRVHALLRLRGKTKGEADELVARFSGHSIRAGYVTSGAAMDIPSYRLQQHARHKSSAMVAVYEREAEKWTKSGLKGIGF
jgi:integrase